MNFKSTFTDMKINITGMRALILTVIRNKLLVMLKNFSGPPLIIDQHIYRDSALVFSVKIYSVSLPILIKWFVGTEKVANSTAFIQTFGETMIQRQLHGTLVTTNGFTANLTIRNISNEHFTYSFFVKNEFGIMTKDFVLDKTGL